MSTNQKRNTDGKFLSSGKTAPTTKKKVATLYVSPKELPQSLRTRLALISEMKKFGFKNSDLQKLLMDIYEQVVNQQNTQSTLAAISGIAASVKPKKDATQMVPVSNIQASSMSPNFETVRSFFLTGSQKHPDFPDWIPSSEIAEPMGMKADTIKKYVAKYVGKFNKDLPNNQAMDLVKRDGGYFRGVSTLVDSKQLPSLLDETTGGLAVWYLMEDGKLVWRNYWSPEAVKAIRELVPEWNAMNQKVAEAEKAVEKPAPKQLELKKLETLDPSIDEVNTVSVEAR